MTTISPLPDAPLPSDTPAQFNTKAFALTAALNTFVGEANALAGELNAASSAAAESAETADSAAWTATTKRDEAVAAAASSSGSAAAAAGSATAAAAQAAALSATSTSSLTIATGSKTFATQTGKQFAAGQWVLAVSAATPGNYMHGQVTSYAGGSLVLNVTNVGGAGATAADWNLSISGSQGSPGATGGLSGGTLTGALNWSPPVTLASAATVDLGGAESNLVTITGTGTITSLGTGVVGAERQVTFAGAATLTHHAASLILPGGSSIVTAAGDVAHFVSLGAGNWRCTSYQRASGLPLVAPSSIASLTRSARTSNTQLAAADKGSLIDITSGTFTQTFAACATLGAGWWCYIRNAGAGDITLDPNGAETIDGRTSYVMYPGECRLVQCDGSALRSVVICGFRRTYYTSGTFTKPPGYSGFGGYLWAGGGSGAHAVNSGGYGGGGGGGGGGCAPLHLAASGVPDSVTVTIGTGGSVQTSVNAAGFPGGDSSFGTLLYARGGGGGTTAQYGAPGGFDVGWTTSYAQPYAGAGQGATTVVPGYGGGYGGQISGGSALAGGKSVFGGWGGDGALTTAGVSGTTPAGGGGATGGVAGVASGAGGNGMLDIWGIV